VNCHYDDWCCWQISSNAFFDDTVGPTERYQIDTKSFDTIDADYDDFFQWCHNLLPGNVKMSIGLNLGQAAS